MFHHCLLFLVKKTFPYVSNTVVLFGLALVTFSCRHQASANPDGELATGADGPKSSLIQRVLGIGGGKKNSPSAGEANLDGSALPAPKPRTPGAGRTNPNVRIPAGTGKRDSRYSQVKTSRPLIAMTFDDGPHPRNTPKLLDMLKKRNIKATFYVVGTNAKRYPQIMQRMVADGHEVGNHTYTHANLSKISDAQIRYQMNKSREVIKTACGVVPTTMRPPYGALSKRQRLWIFNEYGYPSIMWAVDPRDWQRPGSQVVANRLVAGARPGRILLAHDIHAPTITAMPQTFDRLLAKGFQFVTVSQLIAADEKNNPALAKVGKVDGLEADPSAKSEDPLADNSPVDLSPVDISKDARAITLADIQAWEKLHASKSKDGKRLIKPKRYIPLPLKALPSEKKEKGSAKTDANKEDSKTDSKTDAKSEASPAAPAQEKTPKIEDDPSPESIPAAEEAPETDSVEESSGLVQVG